MSMKNIKEIMDLFSRQVKYNYNLQGKCGFKKKAGHAEYYYQLRFDENLENDLKVLSLLKNQKYPFRIFGMGTNLYICSNGYDGLYVDVSPINSYIKYIDDLDCFAVSSNAIVSGFVNYTTKKGYDFSALTGIPGLIGSGAAGNAGWTPSGKSFSSFVSKVRVFDFTTSEFHYIDFEGLGFSDRNSLIKEANRDSMSIFITEVWLRSEKLSEGVVREKCASQMARRYDYLKWGFLDGTAGSVWSNTHLIKQTGKSFPNMLRENESLSKEFNGAKYSKNGNRYFMTDTFTTDEDVAALFMHTYNYVYDHYNAKLYLEMIILDYDGVIGLDDFIKRYYK